MPLKDLTRPELPQPSGLWGYISKQLRLGGTKALVLNLGGWTVRPRRGSILGNVSERSRARSSDWSLRSMEDSAVGSTHNRLESVHRAGPGLVVTPITVVSQCIVSSPCGFHTLLHLGNVIILILIAICYILKHNPLDYNHTKIYYICYQALIIHAVFKNTSSTSQQPVLQMGKRRQIAQFSSPLHHSYTDVTSLT